MSEISVRVFRRNAKNIIILWNTAQLDEAFIKPVVASIVDLEGKESLLAYSKFKPDSPEKFPKDIDGIVISHANNNLDPNTGYKVKLSFSNGNVYYEALQEVLPMSNVVPAEVLKPIESVHMYAYDYANRKWVPLPVDTKLMLEK
jgi:hypothetical protein